MDHIKKHQLRELLYRKVKELRDEAVNADGQVSPEQVEALARLARLHEIYDVAHPPPTRKRWPFVAVLASTLLIVSVLLFARVSETEIELDLTLSEVSFILPWQQVLTNDIGLSALGVLELREIRVPRTREKAAQTFLAPEGIGSAIRLSVTSDTESQGTINLSALILPADTRIWLSITEIPNQYRLSLKGAELVLRAHVNGSVRVGLSNAPTKQLDFLSPKSMLFQPSSDEVDLYLMFSSTPKGVFSSQLSANDLLLFRIKEFLDAEHTVVRRMSTVLSGTMYLEELNGREHTLRPGEDIQFEQSRGEIRTLRLHDDHFALKFHGRVRGMSIGSGENRRSLMPIYLEWLRARHGLSLFWGTTLYLFSLIITVLKWWRKAL